MTLSRGLLLSLPSVVASNSPNVQLVLLHSVMLLSLVPRSLTRLPAGELDRAIEGRKLPTMGKKHPKRKMGEFWGVWRIPIIRTLQDHRCIPYPIRSYNIRILNQSLSISVCVNFEKPKTISFHMSSNVYINLNILVYIIRPYPSRASRGWYQQTTPTRNRRTTRPHQGTSMWFNNPLSSPYLSLGVVLGGD